MVARSQGRKKITRPSDVDGSRRPILAGLNKAYKALIVTGIGTRLTHQNATLQMRQVRALISYGWHLNIHTVASSVTQKSLQEK
jgi:hypothetical protein